MRWFRFFILCSLPILGMLQGECVMADFYVSPQGNDAWSGKQAAPNRASTDGPFATLERARDAIRALKRKGPLPQGGVTVWIRGGIYLRDKTFTLTEEDSGTAGAPIVYRAYPKEEVRLLGGKPVTNWQPVTHPDILLRLDEAARAKVMQADLKALRITDYGEMTPRGFGRPIYPAGLELFFQNKPMTLARWPNNAWTKIAGVPAGQQGGKFTYEGERPAHWKDTSDLWVHGYWTWDWADTYEKVKVLDTQKREIETEPPHGAYGYTAGKRFYFLNVLEELDEPGEWYLDRKTGILYFWPPAPLTEGSAFVSLLEKPLITMIATSHVTVRGLTLECTRGPGVEMIGGTRCVVAGCILRNLGTYAVSLDGKECGVVSCDIYETGDGGIQLSGGNRKTLTPGGNFALNNHIYRYCRWSRTYRPAVLLNGVGNRVAHNLIHDSPHTAIAGGGNEHLIEFNEIHHVCLETNDAGAFYMGRDLTQRGNIVRHNYFHHLGEADLVQAVYLDDCFCGTTVFGNIFYKAGRSVMIGGGRDNVVENNIIVEGKPAVHVDARGTTWASFWFDGRDPYLMDGLKAVNYNQPPYSERYPQLAHILEDEPAKPKGNRIVRNISVGGRWLELHNVTEKDVHLQDNFTEGDPGFVDPGREDFRLKKDSPVWKLGFKPIPVEKIGLYRDQYRRVLPSKSEEP
jgi:hypothetical protein